jgi:hypothetical protein
MTSPKINNPYQDSLLVDAIATYYPDMVQIYIPRQPIVRRLSGFEKEHYGSAPDESEKETDIERSLRRASRRIGDYILCNPFDLFVTFTIKDDRQNAERSKQKVMGWLKNQRNRNGKFRYIVVPEYHKDGQSLHFHALIGGFSGKIERAINPRTKKPLVQQGRAVYAISGYTLGFTNAKLVGSNSEDRAKLSAYLKKYITKEMPIFKGRQRYWVSKGLELPLAEDNPEEWYKHTKPDWSLKTENGTIMRFNLNKNLLVDMFWKEND